MVHGCDGEAVRKQTSNELYKMTGLVVMACDHADCRTSGFTRHNLVVFILIALAWSTRYSVCIITFVSVEDRKLNFLCTGSM